jgi:hypothetical protein
LLDPHLVSHDAQTVNPGAELVIDDKSGAD